MFFKRCKLASVVLPEPIKENHFIPRLKPKDVLPLMQELLVRNRHPVLRGNPLFNKKTMESHGNTNYEYKTKYEYR